MTFGPVVKDPSASLNYSIDWTENLSGETIGTSNWSSSPAGLTVGTVGTFAGLVTQTSVSGGTSGQCYQIINRVTTVSGIVDDRSIEIRVENL